MDVKFQLLGLLCLFTVGCSGQTDGDAHNSTATTSANGDTDADPDGDANAKANGRATGVEQIEVTDARDLYQVYDPETLQANWQDDWPAYPGDPSRIMNVKWAKDGVDADDPDYDRVNKETYYPEGSEEVEMGVFMRTRFPVVLSRLDFDLTYPSEMFELIDVVRHNKTVDPEPGVITNVEVVEPGRVKFTFDLEDNVQLFAPWDRALATLNFKVLQPGAGYIKMYRAEGETWEPRDEESDRLVAPFPEEGTNWVTLADGSGAPYIFDIYNKLVVRE